MYGETFYGRHTAQHQKYVRNTLFPVLRNIEIENKSRKYK